MIYKFIANINSMNNRYLLAPLIILIIFISGCTSNENVRCSDTDYGLEYFVDGDVMVTNTGIVMISDICLEDLVELVAQYPEYQSMLDSIINSGIIDSNQVNDTNILIEAYCPSVIPDDHDISTFQKSYSCTNGCIGEPASGVAATGSCIQ
jgi:hypothetical protein